MTKFERSALKELQGLIDANKIVIKSADKGGAVVVMNAVHYREKVLRVFDNPDYFEPCDGNQSKEILLQIKAFCRKFAKNDPR